MGQGGVACPKPPKGRPAHRRRRRQTATNTKTVRAYVFEREAHRCRVSGLVAESMHELVSAGNMGSRLTATNPRNSIAVDGDGVRGVHGFLQRYEIDWIGDAETTLEFRIVSAAAAKYLSLPVGTILVSPARGPIQVNPHLTCAHGTPWNQHPKACCDADLAANAKAFRESVKRGEYREDGFTPAEWRAEQKRRAEC